MPTTTVHIPAGYALTLVTDALSSGSYVQTAPGTIYTPSDLAVNTTAIVGPFNDARDYNISVTYNLPAQTLAPSGQFTAVDSAAYRPILDPVETYAADGAIALTPGLKKITKSASAAALTLAAPTAAMDGMVIYVVSYTARAHTITATDLLHDGVTGGAKDLATFAAFAGATITLVAMDLQWFVLSKNVVTITAV